MAKPWLETPQQRRRREALERADREDMERWAEEQRLAARSMWERIEDAKTIEDIKEILHLITEDE